MSKGYPFPDVAKLERALTLRGWPLAVLADKAAIAVPDDAIVRFMRTDD